MTVVKQIVKDKFDLSLVKTDNNYYVKLNNKMSVPFSNLDDANETFDGLYEFENDCE